MDQSTFNHGKSGDTNPKGRSRSPLLELYTRSLRNEREEKIGHRTSAACGGRLRLCYTLDEGKQSERENTNCPPKRVRSNAQFEHINTTVQEFQHRGQPVISVDAKKKELVGQFKNGGREWRPQGAPEEVKVDDFVDKELGKVTPYGVYDLSQNEGWVSVG